VWRRRLWRAICDDEDARLMSRAVVRRGMGRQPSLAGCVGEMVLGFEGKGRPTGSKAACVFFRGRRGIQGCLLGGALIR
jgi:hypothetical protein